MEWVAFHYFIRLIYTHQLQYEQSNQPAGCSVYTLHIMFIMKSYSKYTKK